TLLRTDEIQSDFRSSIYYRVADGSEAPSSMWTVNHGTLDIVVAAWSGVDRADPIDGHSGFVDPSMCATSEMSSLTTRRDSSALVFMLSVDGGMTASFPPGMASRWDTAVQFGADEILGPQGTYTRTASLLLPAGESCPRRAIAQMVGLAAAGT